MKQLFSGTCVVTFVLLGLGAHGISAADWTQFRGPAGNATGNDTGLPVKWSQDQNIVWKTELPGAGTSSPITLNGKIYLTSYSGYGLSHNDPGDQADLMRHVICLDAKTGKINWVKDFKPELPESKYQAGNDGHHGYASSTPTTDGKHLYVFFGRSGVYCLTLTGDTVWQATVGSGTRGWGSANSPRLYKNLVIINASVESQSLIALDRSNGKEVWKVDGIRSCWTTPILVEVAGRETPELVVNQPGRPGKIVGYDPATGEQLWFCDGIPDGYVCPSPVSHEGIVYAIGGRKNTAVAVRAGGRGDVTDSHVLWSVGKGSNVSSPVIHEGHLYWFHEARGVAYCLNGKTGKVVYEERLPNRPGLVYSSMTVADGKLYVTSQRSGTFVVDAKPQFKILAVNQLDDQRANASVVPYNGHLLLRNDKYLYRVGSGVTKP